MSRALFFLLYYLFWMFYFALTRAVFVLYHMDKAGQDTGEIIQAFVQAIPLDTSAACYLTALPLLLNFTRINLLVRAVTISIISIVGIINIVDLALYQEWGTRLHLKAIMHLQHPSEVFTSAASQPFWILVPLLAIQLFIGILCYSRWFYRPAPPLKPWYITAISLMIVAPLLIGGIRGGIGEIPINQSAAYFSSNSFLNHAAVNSPWSLIHSVTENWEAMDTNPFTFMDDADAAAAVEKLHTAVSRDTTVLVIEHRRPNIVLIILEGLTADVIPSLGGIRDIVPRFEDLVSEGLLFTDFYATGMRSDKGILGLLSGFPGLPANAVTTQPEKFEKLSCINHPLQDAGYYTSFFFGGDLGYGNLKAYLTFNAFNKVVDIASLPSTLPRAGLGVPDGAMLDYWLGELSSHRQPFFSALFTLTTHEPFDIPASWRNTFTLPKPVAEETMRYLSAVNYSQQAIFDFIQKASLAPWFENTLFVLVPDHSHHRPRERYIYVPRRHQVPLLFYGAMLKEEFRGIAVNKTGAHVDLPATLLGQLGINASLFPWSKDLLNPSIPGFAFYTFIEGFGFVRGGKSFSYEARFRKKTHVDSGTPPAVIHDGNAYMQKVFQDYLGL